MIDTYRQFRRFYNILDSIEATAARHRMEPSAVAFALGLTEFYWAAKGAL